jgi:hypothetical protein
MATFVVDNGLGIVTNRIRAGGTEPTWIDWGTGTGTTTATDTTLFTAAPETRVNGTSSQQTTSTTSDTYRVVGTMTASTSRTITNAGLFDASTAGTLFMKGDFTGVGLSTSESIQFTFNAQFTN